ncbi:hypothetical protein QF015_000410 [Paenarthrobacter sp. TE4293]
MFDTERRPWPGLEPSLRYVCAADLAPAVTAIGNPFKGSPDLFQASLALVEQGCRLGQLERYGAALWVMLVIHVGILSGMAYRGDVASQRLQQLEFAVPLLFQEESKPPYVNHDGSQVHCPTFANAEA